jgi:hypothetical protein
MNRSLHRTDELTRRRLMARAASALLGVGLLPDFLASRLRAADAAA